MLGELIVIALLLILFAWSIFDADIIGIIGNILSMVFLAVLFIFIGACIKIGWNLF